MKYPWSLSNINNLLDDVLGEIFIRLPFRSTNTCKCVCKRWLGLISSHFPTQFVSRQHSLFQTYLTFLSPYQLMLSFFSPDSDMNSLTQKALLPPDMLIRGNVCGCSKGLFLYCIHRYNMGQGYFVYDPLTKECTHIPSFLEADQEKRLCVVGFLSQSLNSTRCFWVVIMNSFILRLNSFKIEVFLLKGKDLETNNCVSCKRICFCSHWMLSFAFRGNLYFMGSIGIFVFNPISLFCKFINYLEGVDAMNTMSFGYLGCFGGTWRIADIGNNDLRVWELILSRTWDLMLEYKCKVKSHIMWE